MGGLETEVSAKTTNVLLESANFDKVSVRRTMQHFLLPSEASGPRINAPSSGPASPPRVT